MSGKWLIIAGAERLMLLGGLLAFVITILFVRKRDIREKYAFGWVGISFIVLLGGLFPRVVMRLAEELRLSYSSFVLYIALGFGYLYAFSVSISLSRQFRRNRRLTQEIALLEARVRNLEDSPSGKGKPPGPPA
ncbi:MAG: DUF2304 domain-containing protein [Lentisphaeria bacterium]|nr:DUF2304 domain-containing protein [Lentisphaeria bacterium]